MPIKNLPLHLRPREKARSRGIETLNDIELLAIFLRSGFQAQDVLEIARQIFQTYDNFHQLSCASIADLQKIKGLGPIKALELASIFEITRRINHLPSLGQKISNWQAAAILAQSMIAHHHQEMFLILLLDQSLHLKFHKNLFLGQTDTMEIDPKVIMSCVLKHEAKRFYCIHNHPSGDHQPSPADQLFTKRLIYLCDILELKLLGHIVVSANGYTQIEV